MSSFPILLLTQKAEVKQGKLSCDSVTLDVIQKYFKKKTEVDMIGTYLYKGLTLFLFGYTKGKAGNENKHELPPPHDATLVFGDIVIIASKDPNSFTTPVPFKVEDYEQFYSKAFGGFDDIDEDDEYEEEEEEEVEDVADEEDKNILEDDVETDHQSYVSEVEEVIEVKKEKVSKKKVINDITILSIHPDKQLKESDEKGEIRMKMIDSIKSVLKDLDLNEIIELEQEIYKKTLLDSESKHIIKDWSVKLFNTLYLSNIRKIVGNLDPTSYVYNKELLKRYKNKEVTLEEICSMDYYSLYESKWKEAIERQKMIEKIQLEGNKSLATEQFLCTKCFKRECTYYEMQTRSADEPMTVFITCLNCGKNWRQ
uniref:TFIIS-type domain-containing protein n=1 Tax=viral metagenome TaxID=1070528 RepID=A0A6C0IEK2_9ZZZZ